jgi:hypothetical protein
VGRVIAAAYCLGLLALAIVALRLAADPEAE